MSLPPDLSPSTSGAPPEAAHPLDAALQLTPLATPGHYQGQSHRSYWNMVGPFGGVTAAALLRALMQHPDRLGEPVSLTVNYAGALAAGPFTVQAVPVRTNRSTQHWTLSILQADPQGADGQLVVATTGTALTAVRRDTWGVSDEPMPSVPPPAKVPVYPSLPGVEWLQRYEMRAIAGLIPHTWDDSGTDSLTQLWVRDAPARPLDFCALAGLADVFYPRVWLRRARRVPAGTVSMTVYFHAGAAQLEETGTGYLLGQARAQAFRNGFFDQTAQLWNEGGALLATTHQIVYYKE